MTMTYNKTYVSSSSSLYYFPPHSTTTIINKAFEFTTLSIIALMLLLSVVSLYSIFHLRRKSRSSLHLQSFNNLWAVRLLLVLFVSSWAINQLLRLPHYHETLNFMKQTNICKLHVVLSLGFLEPGFLVTLLYIINISINRRNSKEKWSLFFVMVMSLPMLFLQIMFLFFTTLKEKLPLFMTQSSFSTDGVGNSRVICTYPLLSSVLFCGFAIVYSMGLLLACWRVGSLVINKTTRMRINMLGATVMTALLVQTLFLGVEPLWMSPDEMGFGGGVSFGVFVSVAVCAVVGEVVLVIKPITEALETAGSEWVGRKETKLPNDAII